jgi:ketosteroid isomerase-like protein
VDSRDPKLTALMFNECINARDLDGLSALMTDDHTFIDREDGRHGGKDRMTKGWQTSAVPQHIPAGGVDGRSGGHLGLR